MEWGCQKSKLFVLSTDGFHIFAFNYSIQGRMQKRKLKFDCCREAKMSLLFYCRNQPRYQRIIPVNQFIESTMPDRIWKIVIDNLTLSITGSTGHFQEGDACLEEINGEAKSWVSPVGVPSGTDWIKVFRNLNSLSDIKQNLLSSASVQNTSTKSSQPKSDPTIDFKKLYR